MKFLICLLLLFSLSFCDTRRQRRPRIGDAIDIDFSGPGHSRINRSRCNRQPYKDEPEVTLTTILPFVDSRNTGMYELEGRCSERDRLVIIEVNGYPIRKNPYCRRGKWKIFLDLTPLANRESNIFFRITHGEDSNVVCEEVRVAFRCKGKGYIPISSNKDFYDSSFCVMKYEAKLEDTQAVSKPEGKPITNVSYADAVALCKNNGSRYDLISNDQWQNIAHLIEKEDRNWSVGKSRVRDGNILNCGVSIGSPKAASTDDRNDCAGSNCGSKWHYKRRAHYLPSGHVIWDMCGNAGEMMKDKNQDNYNFNDYVYKMTSTLRKRFGPDKDYSGGSGDLRRTYYWGLGYAYLKSSGSLIIRGGQNRAAGIFSVNLRYDQDRTRLGHDIGFRCVEIP